MNKRSHASKPHPRTSPVMDSRRPVCAHNNEVSVGTSAMDRRKAILDPANGRGLNGGAYAAPGALGVPEADEGNYLPSSW